MMEFLRALPKPVSDFLDEWFESPALKGYLGVSGVHGSMQGPRASGTAFMLLYQALTVGKKGVMQRRLVRGGMGQLAEALMMAARERGVEIRTSSGVAKILIEGERARGVLLETGEQISAEVIISNANPRHTFFDLVGADQLELQFVRDLKNIRYRGCLARVILALDRLPSFVISTSGTGEEAQRLSGQICICPDLDYLEQAYDDAKYGSFSKQPYLDIAIPTSMDSSLAPPGKHLI
jgi:phytoene dehydrogenase-like protein